MAICPYDKQTCSGNNVCLQKIPSAYSESLDQFVAFCPRARQVNADGIPIAVGLNTV